MIKEQTPSAPGLRKYFTEYIVLGLTGAVVYLFFSYRDLNSYIRENLSTMNAEQRTTIEKNTETLRDLKTYLITEQNKNK